MSGRATSRPCFYFKDVSRVEQLQAAKFSGMSGKSIIFLDFPRQAGLDAQELPGEHRLHKDVKRHALQK